MATRPATHAGSWYSASKSELSRQLDGWLSDVPASTTPIGTVSSQQGSVAIPHKGARAIIAPHAGYSYSGPAAAWAYKSVDWANAKRIFLLGPSHHHYLDGVETTQYSHYETPLGNLEIDHDTVSEIAQSWGIKRMKHDVDDAEHSLEMHLPYIYKMLALNFPSPLAFPPLTPLLIGSASASTERRIGSLLAPYLLDPGTIFVISSDFCHWGSRFGYTYYQPPSPHKAVSLQSNSRYSIDYPIHKSIAAVDMQSMDAVESGSHETFLGQVKETGNTVCGRHPIGVFMAAVEEARKQGKERGAEDGNFKFLRYERSSLVSHPRDSSVSYCSAFAVLA
ncbi:MEMO1 family [Clohesyomyces aquaticus]|uniref:MEMO1 family n=1 Tax=Clohesyomyces aquaticus TaxID=1231657 RepID=A0A1Y1YKZ9_9PLEO|nr:MEMO1 family [Clohesyomyces aquaticus]